MAAGKQITGNKTRKRELITQLAQSRQSISYGRDVLKKQLQVKKQLRRLVFKKPKAVFAGSVVAGLVITLLLKRPGKTKKSSPKTAAHLILGWGLAVLKPAAKAWLVTRAKKLATDRLSGIHPTQQKQAQPGHRVLEGES